MEPFCRSTAICGFSGGLVARGLVLHETEVETRYVRVRSVIDCRRECGFDPGGSRLNVFQLISSEGFYGAESMLVTLSRELAALHCNVVVGVFEDKRSPHLEVAQAARQAGLSVRTIPCSGRFDRRTVACLRTAIRESDADIIHTHGYKADLYGYTASFRLDVARVSTCHLWPSRPRILRLYELLDRLILRAFHRVSSPSRVVIAALKRSLIASSKLKFIPNGVSVEAFDRESHTERPLIRVSNPVVGFVGRLVAVKGGDTLLRTAPSILERHPKATFVFVGEGRCRADWENLAAQLGISDHVVFTGVCKDMPAMYSCLDVMVLPSFEEAMPMSLLEAMSARKPVVATPVGAVSELVIDGVNGYFVTPGDVPGLTEAILRVLESPARRQELGNKAHCHVFDHFSSHAMVREYLALYEEALRARREKKQRGKQHIEAESDLACQFRTQRGRTPR